MPSTLTNIKRFITKGALVLAGAGTGKTRVLTERISRLLSDNLATPHQILAVTFTNKAALEMRKRIEAALPARPDGLTLGTFHSICHRILRIHAVAANHLIAANKNRLGKTLTTSTTNNEAIAIHAAYNDIEEANDIAGNIRTQLDKNIPASDIAILYRTNAQGRLFERALMENGIPYRVYGGLRFYDRMEIKHALAYLRLIVSDDRDALLRVINVPTRGIGSKTVEGLTATDNPFVALETPTNRKLAAFWALIKTLRTDSKTASLSDLTRLVIEKSGLLEDYENRKELERADNLRELVNATTQFATIVTDDTTDILLAFLATAALTSDLDNPEADKPAVSLMTVHAAKGLEFNQVIIVGLEEGLFPHARSLDSPNARDLEEERRLLYVAITRARRHLSIHFARQRMLYGRPVYNPASRFLNELPTACLADKNWKMPKPTPAPAILSAFRPKQKPFRYPERPTGESSGFRPGDWVQHAKYGRGIVLRCEGSGENAQADITFKKFGIKSFKLAIAPLEKIS